MQSTAKRKRYLIGGEEVPLDITILVGTMTATAQLVGQEIELKLDDNGDTREIPPVQHSRAVGKTIRGRDAHGAKDRKGGSKFQLN